MNQTNDNQTNNLFDTFFLGKSQNPRIIVTATSSEEISGKFPNMLQNFDITLENPSTTISDEEILQKQDFDDWNDTETTFTKTAVRRNPPNLPRQTSKTSVGASSGASSGASTGSSSASTSATNTGTNAASASTAGKRVDLNKGRGKDPIAAAPSKKADLSKVRSVELPKAQKWSGTKIERSK